MCEAETKQPGAPGRLPQMCPEQVRVFTGQMRWPPRSLEAQLNDGLWLPCLLSPSLMFSQRKPEVVWNEVCTAARSINCRVRMRQVSFEWPNKIYK